MSVLIKGMEMPLEKSRIIQIYPDGTVRRLDGSIYNSHFEAVHVPPHGRLIDADELKTAFPCGESVRTECVRATIDYAPTIIPAEPINNLSKPCKDDEDIPICTKASTASLGIYEKAEEGKL